MKTRRLATVLTSAYLSAMLLSSVAPIGRSILAAPIDPAGAQAAFDQAIGRLDPAAWAAAAPTAVPVTLKAEPAPAGDPVMTPELLARITRYARNMQKNATMDAAICKIFARCDGKTDLPIKNVSSDIDGHNIAYPIDTKVDDIYVVVHHDNGTSHGYLTDHNGTLRAAAFYENGAWRLLTNEQGAAGFKAEMNLFAKEAQSLPPSGTSVASAGNS